MYQAFRNCCRACTATEMYTTIRSDNKASDTSILKLKIEFVQKVITNVMVCSKGVYENNPQKSMVTQSWSEHVRQDATAGVAYAI